MKKLKKLFYPLLGILCSLLILTVTVIHIALPDRGYSSSEKRSLKTFPGITQSGFLDGSLMSGMDDYASDQFPGRDRLMKLRMNLMLLLGMNESKGVYYTADGSLIEAFQEPDRELLSETVQAVNRFTEGHSFQHVSFLLVPTAALLNADALPVYSENADQAAYIREFTSGLSGQISAPDLLTAMQNVQESGTEAYYKTDHHWTTDGAYGAFRAVKEELNLSDASYRRVTARSDFSGTLPAKSGFTPKTLDSLVLYLNDTETVLVNHEETGTAYASMYVSEKLDSDNAYEVFFGGNEPMITIQTTADTERTLLLLKDSYANAMIPFLTASYQKITVIDPRYYSDSLETLLKGSTYTDLMFLYNASTLSADENLRMVLSE